MSKIILTRPLTYQIDSYVDYKDIIAKHSARLLTGNGCQLSHSDEAKKEWVDKFFNENNINRFINQVAYNLSEQGIVVVGFDKYGENDIRIFLCQNGLSKVIKRYEQIIGAEIYKKVPSSMPNMIFFVREVWNMKEIKRQYFYNKDKVQLSSIIANIPKEWQLPEKEKNIWGIIPFVDFNNLPQDNDGRDVKDVQDTNFLPKFINRIRKMLFSEAQKNQTRILGQFNNQRQADEFKHQIGQGNFNDYLVSHGTYDQTGKPAVQVIQGQSNILEYQEAIERMEKQLFAYCGYSYSAVIEGVSATEIAVSNSVDNKTTNIKRALFTERMGLLLQNISKVLKLEGEFMFELNDNVNTDLLQELTVIEKELNLGLTTKERAIAKFNNIPLDEAKERFDEVQKEQDTQAEKDMALIKASGGLINDKSTDIRR